MKTKEELSKVLKDVYIPFRENIKLNPLASIGLEIEFVEGLHYVIEKELKENKNLKNRWIIYEESTTTDRNLQDRSKTKGGEVLSPTITKEIDIWRDLKEVCNIIKNAGGTIDERAAGHIHIGGQSFENEEVSNNFLIIWSAFEEEINKFFAGEYIYPKDDNPLAIDCKNEFKKANYNFEKMLDIRDTKTPTKIYSVGTFYFNGYRYMKYNTVEFRKIRGSLDEAIWQNNIIFILNLIEYAKKISKEDLIYIKENLITETKEEPSIEKACFLADKIYNDELEKLYFLKQFLKNFKTSDNVNEKINITKKTMVKKLKLSTKSRH